MPTQVNVFAETVEDGNESEASSIAQPVVRPGVTPRFHDLVSTLPRTGLVWTQGIWRTRLDAPVPQAIPSSVTGSHPGVRPPNGHLLSHHSMFRSN